MALKLAEMLDYHIGVVDNNNTLVKAPHLCSFRQPGSFPLPALAGGMSQDLSL